MNVSAPQRALVAGASAGGVEALAELVRSLDQNAPMAIFVVLHVSPTGLSVLPAILTRAGRFTATHAVDGELIESGHIYVAPPDHHLLIRSGRIQLSRGAKENSFRPAVDTLFRSAADAYGRNAIGVVLSGSLDDGSAGLLAVAQAGGITMTQTADEAAYPSMPESAARATLPFLTAPVQELARTINDLTARDVFAEDVGRPVPAIDVRMAPDPTDLLDVTEVLPYSCPNCNGSMLMVRDDDELVYFRCRVGHGYSGEALAQKQAEFLDDAVWTAIRALEERQALSLRLAARLDRMGHGPSADRYRIRAADSEEQATIIRQLLIAPSPLDVDGEDLPRTGAKQ